MPWLRLNLNSLLIFEWDRRFPASDPSENPTVERLLEFLCPQGTSADMSGFKKRYLEVSENDGDLLLYPEEPKLKENVFGPLRQAKTSYITGNYVGTTALCGIVAEKVALLIHALRSSSKASRKKFERRRQSCRVKALLEAGHIDKQQKKDFDDIRKARDSTLHRWGDTSETTASKRATQAYAAATRLVLRVMDIEYSNGAVKLHPKLTEYLAAHGEILFEKDDA